MAPKLEAPRELARVDGPVSADLTLARAEATAERPQVEPNLELVPEVSIETATVPELSVYLDSTMSYHLNSIRTTLAEWRSPMIRDRFLQVKLMGAAELIHDFRGDYEVEQIGMKYSNSDPNIIHLSSAHGEGSRIYKISKIEFPILERNYFKHGEGEFLDAVEESKVRALLERAVQDSERFLSSHR